VEGLHGPWRRLGLGPRFYFFLILGIGVVLAACWAVVLWQRPDLIPIFLSWYLPIGSIVFGFALGATLLAMWLAKKYE
jgi:hypothetical protein